MQIRNPDSKPGEHEGNNDARKSQHSHHAQHHPCFVAEGFGDIRQEARQDCRYPRVAAIDKHLLKAKHDRRRHESGHIRIGLPEKTPEEDAHSHGQANHRKETHNQRHSYETSSTHLPANNLDPVTRRVILAVQLPPTPALFDPLPSVLRLPASATTLSKLPVAALRERGHLARESPSQIQHRLRLTISPATTCIEPCRHIRHNHPVPSTVSCPQEQS